MPSAEEHHRHSGGPTWDRVAKHRGSALLESRGTLFFLPAIKSSRQQTFGCELGHAIGIPESDAVDAGLL